MSTLTTPYVAGSRRQSQLYEDEHYHSAGPTAAACIITVDLPDYYNQIPDSHHSLKVCSRLYSFDVTFKSIHKNRENHTFAESEPYFSALPPTPFSAENRASSSRPHSIFKDKHFSFSVRFPPRVDSGIPGIDSPPKQEKRRLHEIRSRSQQGRHRFLPANTGTGVR
ncbi:hypothetical protein CDAR_165371 [Caerostris darwini]|uniref:Uncharacterized protein n=1 Tax=Caerostris darwini TaxID=1538125 RepID=A0AAV4NYJ0_9ARAC|nr:hypothetical protein CDAR_165371 [Caerostris darwini]